MLIDYKRKFFSPDSAPGKNGEETEDNLSGKTGKEEVEVDEEYQQLVKDVDEQRNSILNEDSEDETGSKKPEESEELAGKKDDETKGEDKTLPDSIEVNEDFINQETFADDLKFDKLNQEYLKEALSSIKGKNVDTDVLKNYVHTQVTLQELKAGNQKKELDEGDFLTEKPEREIPAKVELDTTGLSEEEIENVNMARAQALYARLKPKYKDLSIEDLENKDAVNEYISSMNINNPLDADEFKQDYRKENSEIVKAVNDYKKYSTEWPNIMRNDATEQIKKFEGYLAKKELTVADLGKTLDEAYIINNILQDENGKLKPDLISYYKNNNQIPILNKDKFYQALLDHFDDEITSTVEKRGVNSFIDNKERKKPNPSISESTIPGTEKEPVKTVIPDDSIDFEEMDRILEENRKKILKSDGSTY